MRAGRVPLRHSLVVRLLATSVVVAICAIVATAWLAVQSTTRAVRQAEVRALSDDRSVYDALLGYAATHPDWSGVRTVVEQHATKLNRRITLMTEDRQVLVDSSAGPSLHAARPSAVVDPLRVDPGLTGGTDSIDPRAVGPYRLPPPERTQLRSIADKVVECMAGLSVTVTVRESPSGRPLLRSDGPGAEASAAECGSFVLRSPTATEQAALGQLRTLIDSCLGDTGPGVAIDPDFAILVKPGRAGQSHAEATAEAQRCLHVARQAQLKPHVAPPTLLFVSDPAADDAQPTFQLSRTNTLRIVAVTALVLLVAILVTVVVGRRLVRPLRQLTEAARRPNEHAIRVPVTTRDEIGVLATALNDLSERREHIERQRKAMVNDVAHELRTPLTNIRSWLEAAQDGLTRPDPQLLELLLEEAVLLQRIIDDLRDLAAADADELRVHPEPVYVTDLVAQVVAAHRGAADAAGVHLRMEPTGDPEVSVDPARLRQLVSNLVSNAIRHTPPDGTVTVGCKLAGESLTVTVADTGTGIAPHDLPRIFDRFWRADASRTRATGGSGLGLAIARKLAQAHGGDITVTSRVGVGTTFVVRLGAPAAAAAQS